MITKEKLRIPIAELGEVNPLPDIKNNTYIHASIDITDKISEEEAKYIGKGMIPTLLPYLAQDGYNRDKVEGDLDIIVLENEYLRAEFLPGLGARLRRLYDKKEKRELLYVNPVFQACNLALRNAWFSGGTEFNVGIKGHNPLTCSPMFAERRVDAEGCEYVSFYEYERVRGVVWSVNAYLPEGAKALMFRMCIENTSDEEKYMYWWSNIAVEETEGVRVLVPTHETFINYFGDDCYVLDKGNLPNELGTDISYPGNLTRTFDFFYKIPKENRKWIASVEPSGKGFLHFSDDKLIGRKLFLWGQCRGGRHFSEYLAEKNSYYIEIQAGLAHTQLEHFPMPPHSKLEWVEGYTSLSCAPEDVSGNYDRAVEATERELSELLKTNIMNVPELTSKDKLAESEMLYRGSGWGMLEKRIRDAEVSNYFDDWYSEDRETADYRALINNGYLPNRAPNSSPESYVSGALWVNKLRESLKFPEADHYYTYLALGVSLYERGCYGDKDAMNECLEMWKKSLEKEENPWAYRNIAAYFANEEGDKKKAADYSEKALFMKPDERALAVDCGQIMLGAGEYERWIEICKKLPEKTAAVGRVSLLRARALMALGRYEEAEGTVNENFEMPDIKEGELSISALWFELKAKQNGISVEEAKKRFILPYSLDFRMH